MFFFHKVKIHFFILILIDFNQVGQRVVHTTFADELYFVEKVIPSVYKTIKGQDLQNYNSVNLINPMTCV